MKIVFGLNFDGLNPQKRKSRCGIKTVGPSGLLSIIETQLGLPSIVDSHTSRVISYQKRIEAAGVSGRFFEQSYQVDPFNVVSELLSWRDLWFLEGWDGKMASRTEKRLNDIADIELQAHLPLSPCQGERITHLIKLLADQKTQIEEIQLIQSLAELPVKWQELIQLFNYKEPDNLKIQSEEGSDLHQVQTILLNLNNAQKELSDKGVIKKQTLKSDGSFYILKAQSKTVSARLVADYMAKQPKDMAIISDSDGLELDEACELNDLPRLGFKRDSSARPIFQVLPLSVGLLWEPLNPEILLDFLLLPYSPIPKRIRQALASVVADNPGINGDKWKNTLSRLLEKEGSEKQKQIQETIEQWLMPERYPVSDGIPAKILCERSESVAQWLMKRLPLIDDEAEQDLFRAAENQSRELAQIFSQFDIDTRLTTEQVNYLIEQVIGNGKPLTDRFAEADEHNRNIVIATEPSGFTEYFDTVFWWDMQGKVRPGVPYSVSELQCLNQHGVTIPSNESLYAFDAKNHLKPVLSAKKRLFLIVHEDTEYQHPVIDQLKSYIKDLKPVEIEESIINNQPLLNINKNSLEIQYQALPAYRRWWQVEAKLEKRNMESFSSIDTLLKSPYQWVLNYKAKLRQSSLTELSDGNTLKGNLMHHLFERFFNQNKQVLEHGDINKDVINRWVNKNIDELLKQEGSVLLQAGRSIECSRFKETARTALSELIRQLHRAKIKEIHMEEYNEGEFFGGTLGGYIDALVINHEGKEGIIDIKWGGKSYREQSFKDNEHLQLVTYSYLRKKKNSAQGWPPVAYFIIDNAQLMTQDKDYFPGAYEVHSYSDENVAQIWQRIERTWQWRQKQLQQGLIEVTIKQTEPDEQSQSCEDCVSIPENSDYYNDYSVLTGWRKP